MFYRLSDSLVLWAIFLVKVPSSQMTASYVKLTQNEAAQSVMMEAFCREHLMKEDSLTVLFFPHFPKERCLESIKDCMYYLLFAIDIFTI